MRRFLWIALLVAVVLTAGAIAFPVPVTAQEPEELINDAFVPFDDPSITGRIIGPLGQPGYYQTSEFMIGRVAIAIVLPESDGSIDPSTEDWTQAEINKVVSEITAAMDWWKARESRVPLEVVVYELHVVPTSYEPINRSYRDEELWVGEVMSRLGFEGANFIEKTRAFTNDLRNRHQTDWAFTIFVVDSSNDWDGFFIEWGIHAWACLGGPSLVMTYDNGMQGIDHMARVCAHEVGHIFHARDQACGVRIPCTVRYGYLAVEHQNSEWNGVDCGGCALNERSIMKKSGGAEWFGGLVDPYARGQVGWWDSDGDGIFDPVDTTLAISLMPQAQNPRGEGPVTYIGSVEDIPWDSPTRPDLSINTIALVEYRLNRGSWLATTAADGAFDGLVEDYTFTTAHLTPGVYVIDIRAISRFGGVGILEEGDILIVLDPVDGALNSTLFEYQPDPTAETAVTYIGIAATSGAAITNVEWRVDGGGWVGAAPVDGAFDSGREHFAFATGELARGVHIFESRARDSTGKVETGFGRDELTVRPSFMIYLPLVLR